MAAKGWCSVARQTFGRLTPFSPPLTAQNAPSGPSSSDSFGPIGGRPKVENPVARPAVGGPPWRFSGPSRPRPGGET